MKVELAIVNDALKRLNRKRQCSGRGQLPRLSAERSSVRGPRGLLLVLRSQLLENLFPQLLGLTEEFLILHKKPVQL